MKSHLTSKVHHSLHNTANGGVCSRLSTSRQSISHNKKKNERYRNSLDSDDFKAQRLSIGNDLQDKLKALDKMNSTLKSQKKELSVLKNKVN